jgi:hypothetical protein|tara:strand:+ start:984 stop:1397 length:414 start_codon:yes stop_codon:yes gene_type:complete
MPKTLPKAPEKKRRHSAQKMRVAAARVAGQSKLAVAETEGIDPKTIWNWEHNCELYNGYLDELAREVKKDALHEAYQVVRGAMRPTDSQQNPIPMHVRLRAALGVIQSADRSDTVEHKGAVDLAIRVVEVPERKRNG